MQLPTGVYVVSQSFEGAEGTLEFTFQGAVYEAQPGINALAYLEELATLDLQIPEQPFCGYKDKPVVILPAGLYKAGTLKESRFRTYLPCEMVLLGENAGISPNAADLASANSARRTESVIQGSFYFGAIAMRNGVEGTLILDGLELNSVKVYDERSEAEYAGLTVKNCSFTGALIYDLIRARVLEQGTRVTRLSDCRLDGTGSYFGEGRLLDLGSGSATVERLCFANTDKFPGLTNYSRTARCDLNSFLIKDSLFLNCGSVHGLSILPSGTQPMEIRLENCEFTNFAPAEDAALFVKLFGNTTLEVAGCRFHGAHSTAAVEIDGHPSQAILTNTTQTGYTALSAQKAPRRTAVARCSAPLADPHDAIAGDMSSLDALYADRQPYYCDFHCHSNSGGTSDGKTPLCDYVEGMKALGVDCAAIVDHRQMRHYFLPQWDEQYLICGSEPSTRIAGKSSSMDYTMIFPDKTGLAQVMGAFPEFGFTGGWDGHFKYAGFTRERFRELGEYIYAIGGLVSHAHPLQLPGDGVAEEYFFSEQMAFETVHADVNAFSTRQNHNLWVKMLNLGYRVKTHGSSDSHGPVSNRGLSTVYAQKHFSTDIFNEIRSGNCTAGGVGIQMSIGDAAMGSSLPFMEGLTLCIRAGDFHRAHWLPNTVYALSVYTEQGLAYRQEFDGTQPLSVVLPVKQRKFYRCEITNESDNLPVAFSNPIWLD